MDKDQNIQSNEEIDFDSLFDENDIETFGFSEDSEFISAASDKGCK